MPLRLRTACDAHRVRQRCGLDERVRTVDAPLGSEHAVTALYAVAAVAVPVRAFVAALAYQGRRIDRRDLTPNAPLDGP